MAFYRANSGGGSPTDTTLWTNSAPTSSYSGGDVTLSQSIENFDLIGIEYLNYTGGSTTGRIMIDIASFRKCVSGAANNNVRFTMGTRWSGYSNNYVRMLYYVSDTQASFTDCTRVGASGTGNGFCIPQKIVGIKL